MSAQHTPGPWAATQWYDEAADISGWSFSAAGYLLPLSEFEGSADVAAANACLIAAAPDLLAACIDGARLLAHMNGPADSLRAAIAKATGGTT